ncbi:response regulator transcription factor [uncultured Thiohalocapsa sp.]|jgi:DNA-binding NarL/FixJ family response regulator|uniref:response regulator n=1 Tax=uncultured Thiohalocapsa sp. TaxID=768990 RepID=UPI0025FB5480|nr:response regulator transcription factor [uncultured Thiohalocapsa sp.]
MTLTTRSAAAEADHTGPSVPAKPLRLLLCDDHALFREGLAALLQRRPDRKVVGEAASGAEAVRLAALLKPDLVVLDVGLPDITGIDAAHAIRGAAADCIVVALSMYADGHYVEGMLSAGARAYVLKNDVSGELLEAIDAASRGERYLSRTLRLASGADTAHGDETAPAPLGRCPDIDRDLLTGRERQVLCLLARGRRAKQIATELDISIKTVETYRSRVMHKLHIDNLPGLVRFAIRAGLVTAE